MRPTPRHEPTEDACADAIVLGLGPTGLATAVALALLGLDVVGIGAPQAHPEADLRTTALFGPSVTFLENLGVWEAVRPASAPVRAIRLIDDTGRLLRAPEVLFESREIGKTAFGWNVPLAALVPALEERAGRLRRPPRLIRASVNAIGLGSDRAEVMTADGNRLRGRLLVGADGRGSPSRAAAGIEVDTWSYPQAALVCSFGHSRAHHDVSIELHRRHGPLTTVPLPGAQSGLVWVDEPGEIRRLAALGEAELAAAIEHHTCGLLGAVADIGPRGSFALSSLRARRLYGPRLALVGEAAHAFPPIGAQGLNLSLRDIACLADHVATAQSRHGDPGHAALLEAYDTDRRGDIDGRIRGVDLLNRSLLSDLLPAQALRGAALHILSSIAPLRRALLREGIAEGRATPRLLRADAGGLPVGRARASALEEPA